MSQHTIDDPLALGVQYQLGNHRATYKPSTISRFIGLTLALFIVIGLLEGIIHFQNGLSQPLVLFPLFICLFIASAVLYGLIETYRNRILRVFVYDNGLIYVGQNSLQCIYWQNVQTVWHKVERQTSSNSNGYSRITIKHTYTVNCIDGTFLKLDDTFAHVRQLGGSLEVETAPYILPGVLSTYQMSQSVVFGPLAVTPEGLRYGAKTLPWTEMESININEYHGQIVIKKRGNLLVWASIGLGNLPNIEVFRMLIQHITGVQF